MQNIKFFSRLIFLLAVLPVGLANAGDPEAGKASYMACAACHGQNAEGSPAMKGPALSALSEKYIVAQLEKFQNKHRGGDPKDTAGLTMASMVMTVASAEAKANVAAYIASLESTKPATTISGNADNGKALYGTCAACHGADAKGNDLMNAPSLINQHDWYLVTQLKNFKEGIRGTHPDDATGAQMRPMAMMLADDQAINDVVAYLSTLD